MRILYYYACEESMMFQWQKIHIINEMEHHNHEIQIFNPLSYKTLDEANDEVINTLMRSKYDLFMSCHHGEVLYPDTVQRISQLGIPTLNFRPDNLVIPFFDKHSAKYYDLVWLTSKETEYLYKRWGCNTVFLPYAANPFAFNPVYSQTETERICFIGNPHGSRIDVLNYLLNGEIPVSVHTLQKQTVHKVFSAPMENYRKVLVKNNLRYPIGIKLTVGAIKEKFGQKEINLNSPYLCFEDPVALSELSTAYSSYSLSLSFTDANSTSVLKKPVKIVNLRNFEIPMAGGLQITMYSPEIAQYFEDGKEIILAKSKDELIDKAKFYLGHDNIDLRRKMKINARKRAENEHTWNQRFEKVFQTLGI